MLSGGYSDPGRADQSERELEAQIEELVREHDLAKAVLRIGFFGTIIAAVTAVVILLIVSFTVIKTGEQLLSGNHFVAIVAIVVVGLVAFFSVVQGRVARIKVELSEARQSLDIRIREASDR